MGALAYVRYLPPMVTYLHMCLFPKEEDRCAVHPKSARI